MRNNKRTRKLLFSSRVQGKTYMQMKRLETILENKTITVETVPVYIGGKN